MLYIIQHINLIIILPKRFLVHIKQIVTVEHSQYFHMKEADGSKYALIFLFY